MTNYSKMTQEEFDDILVELLETDGIRHILTIDGIYEILSENYNNDVLDVYERRYEK